MHPTLIILILFLTLLGVWIFKTRNRRPSKDSVKWIAIIAAVVLIALAASGRIHWISVVIAGLLAFARVALPLLMNLSPYIKKIIEQNIQKKRFHRAGTLDSESENNRSTVSTSILEMNLNHETGEMNGQVIAGTFAGKTLKTLNLEQCVALYEECKQTDEQSTELLAAYLSRRFGENWHLYGQNKREQNKQKNHHGMTNGGNMDKSEAYEVLGLSPTASKDEIIAAHRTLMQKLHPDRGGSTYLASKLNQAKDCLLG